MSKVHFGGLALWAIGLTTAILILTGCGAVNSAPAPPDTPRPADRTGQPEQKEPTPTPALEGFYPSNTRTGIAEVDRLIEAVGNGNMGGLLDQYSALELPCVKREGLGAPLCPADRPAGTPVKVYAYAGCDLAFLTDQRDLRGHVESAFRGGTYLFAIYRTSQAPGLDKATPAHAIVFGGGLDDQSAPTVYLDKEGHLVLVRWGCGTPDLAVPVGSDLVLAPKVTASDEKRSQAEAGLASLVEGEARQMYNFLRIALGEYNPCSGSTPSCIMDTNFPSIVNGLLMRCDKVGPEAQMSGYAYNEQRHGPVFRPYKAACDTLRNAHTALGEPKEAPEWKERALQARRLLEPAVRYLDSQSGK